MLSEQQKKARYLQSLVKKQYIDPQLRAIIREIRKKLRQDWDRVIAITGYEGTGKSSLALYLAYLIADDFDLYDNLSLIPDAKEIKTKFKKTKQFGVYVIDEAVKSLHKHDWHNKLQQTLIKMYATERRQNKCTVMLMPRFLDFTENFRNHRIKLWFHVFSRDTERNRATAVLYVKDDRDKDSPDPWHMKENYKLKQKLWKGQHIADISIDQIMRAEQRTKCYLLHFEYPKLPDEIEEVYKELKRQAGEENYDDDDMQDKLKEQHKQREALWKARMSLLITKLRSSPTRYSIKKIASLSRVNPSTIKLWLKDTKDHEEFGQWLVADDPVLDKQYTETEKFFPISTDFHKEQKVKPQSESEGGKQ